MGAAAERADEAVAAEIDLHPGLAYLLAGPWKWAAVGAPERPDQ